MTLRRNIWLYSAGAVFAALNALLIFETSLPLLAALPVVIFILFASVYHTDKVLLSIFLFTPLSMNLEQMGEAGLGMYLPTEPLLLGLTVLFTLDQLLRPSLDRKLLLHPISISIYLYLVWLLVTTLTSSDMVVSFKFFLARVWFFVPIYFYGAKVFTNRRLAVSAIWAYLIPMTGVAIYTLVRHAATGFAEDPAHYVMTPFFKDHTSYGAILALFIPVIIGLFWEKNKAFWYRPLLSFILLVFFIALYFSFTRAAWISMVVALGVYALMHFRVKFLYVAILALIGVGFIMSKSEQLLLDLKLNKAEHTTENFEERLESVSNISTDASNLERLNRWDAAYHMYLERQMVGWGPGTYAFEYGRFQDPEYMTIISTHFGDKGNAHSEYLGALAESGLPGALIFIALVTSIFVFGVVGWLSLNNNEDSRLVITLIVGLSTYFFHSALNNYLDTDKGAVPVWGFVAIVVALTTLKNRQVNS